MILHYFRKKENLEKELANNIYVQILNQSNFYLKENSYFKQINYNTSYEIITILIIIYMELNIKFKIKNYKKINDQLMSIFISDLDESLRSKGIGDMSIGKYVKSYVKKFYFRLSKFPKDIDQLDNNCFINYIKYFDFVKEKDIKDASEKFLELYKNIYNSYK